MGVKEMNVCQHVSCLKPQTLKTVHRTHFGFNALLFHSFLCNVCQIRVFDARASSFACTRHSKNTRVFVCVCVCVCVWLVICFIQEINTECVLRLKHTHTHTHVGFYGLRGLSIGVMVFILYKLYVLLPYTYPTPKLSPHRRQCISIFPQKNSLCMIYKHFKLWGHWKCPHKSPSPCNTYVIPMSLYKFVSS